MSAWLLNIHTWKMLTLLPCQRHQLRGCQSDISISQNKKSAPHPGGYWAKTCMKKKEKTKSWWTDILDLLITAITNDMIAE